MSIASEKRKRAALRRKRRDKGRCTDCGKTPLAMNADGTQSVKCEKCHAKGVGRSYKKQDKNEAVIADVEPTPLTETREFKRYEPQVENLICHTQCGVTESEINRALQPPHPDWTTLALERLFESVEGRQVGAFWKYFPRELRRTPNPTEGNYHAGIFGRFADNTKPHPESMGAKL